MITIGIDNIRKAMAGFYGRYRKFRDALDGWELKDILELQDPDIEYLFRYAIEASGMVAQADAQLADKEQMSRSRRNEYYRNKGYHEVPLNDYSLVDDLDPEKTALIKEQFYETKQSKG